MDRQLAKARKRPYMSSRRRGTCSSFRSAERWCLCLDSETQWMARYSGARPFRHRQTTTTSLNVTSNMAGVATRAPYNVRCSYSAKQLTSEVRTWEKMCRSSVFPKVDNGLNACIPAGDSRRCGDRPWWRSRKRVDCCSAAWTPWSAASWWSRLVLDSSTARSSSLSARRSSHN